MSYQFLDKKAAVEFDSDVADLADTRDTSDDLDTATAASNAASDTITLQYDMLEHDHSNLQSLVSSKTIRHLSLVSKGAYKPNNPENLERAIDILCGLLVQNTNLQYFLVLSDEAYSFDHKEDVIVDIFHPKFFVKLCEALIQRSERLALGFSTLSIGLYHYKCILQVVRQNSTMTEIEWFDQGEWVDTSVLISPSKIYDHPVIRRIDSLLQFNKDFNTVLNGGRLLPTHYSPKAAEEQLEDLVKSFDSSANIFFNKKGFHFVASGLFVGSRIIETRDSPFKGKLHLDAEKVIGLQIKQKTFRSHTEKDHALSILSSEYKIHLMPKPHYMLFVVKILLETIRCESELLEHIYAFKVKAVPKETAEVGPGPDRKLLPHIVIYLSLGKKSADLVLKKLYEYFARFDTREIGMNVPARYSLLLNGIMSYAQGGGDIKNLMTDSQKEDFLSQSEVHYRIPDQHLENPAMEDLEYFSKMLQAAFRGTPFNFSHTTVLFGDTASPLPQIRFWQAKAQESETPNTAENEDALFQGFYNEVLKPLEIDPPFKGQEEERQFYAVLLPGCIEELRSAAFQQALLSRAKVFSEARTKVLTEPEDGPPAKRIKTRHDPTLKKKHELSGPEPKESLEDFRRFTRSQARLLELVESGMMTRSKSAKITGKPGDTKEKSETDETSVKGLRRGKKRKRE